MRIFEKKEQVIKALFDKRRDTPLKNHYSILDLI